MKKFVLFLLVLSNVLFSNEKSSDSSKGIVYLIVGSDVSISPYNLTSPGNLLWSSQLYSDSTHNGYTVMKNSFRNQYLDSYGNTIKFTWWMMGGNVYDISNNCNVPVKANYTIFLMKKYHIKEIEEFDDQLSFHFHNYLWSDIDGDGNNNWNQGTDFSLSKDDFELTLCKYLIEDDVFPVSFRSGWHYMNNEWQAYNEKFIPFDLSNAYPSNTGSSTEPYWWVDWSESPSAFVPYHPDANNYQIEGDLKQWRLRSQSIQENATLQSTLEIMFQEAAAGKNQMLCTWGHLAEESAFLTGVARLNNYAKTYSSKYGVEFKYCKDTEAFRLWLNPADTIAPVLTVNEIYEGDKIRFVIETDGPVFQREEPFVAIKTIYETYERLECTRTGENKWETNEAITSDIIAKAAFAVCDSVGNQSKVHLKYLPDDVFIDEKSQAYQETSGSWSDYTSGQLWDLKARLLTGKGSVKITPDIEEDGIYKVLIHAPASTTNNVRVILQNNLHTDSVLITTTLDGTNKWQQIGFFNFVKGEGNSLTIENLAEGKNLGLDVIRFSPLIPQKYFSLETDSLIYGEITVTDTTYKYIIIKNSGFDWLTVNMTNSDNRVSIFAKFPIQLNSGETLEIPVGICSNKPCELTDEIVIESDDPVHSLYRIPVSATVVEYFKVIDNEDVNGYSESGDWYYSGAWAYGTTSRYSWVKGNGAYADFSTKLSYAGTYDVQYVVPATTNAHNHADYILFIDGTVVDTVDVDQNACNGEFVSIGKYYLPSNKVIKLRIQDNGGNTQVSPYNIVLRADAVKFLKSDDDVNGVTDENNIPASFKVSQNYPNPFNPSTKISFALPEDGFVQLRIFNILGQEIATLINSEKKAGNHSVEWNAGSNFVTGIYFYQLEWNNQEIVKKMLLVK